MERILVIGETCKDIFIYCNATRIAPDLPVPVLELEYSTENPGMAMNVQRNILNIFRHCDLVTNSNWQSVTKTRYVHSATNHMFIRIDTPHLFTRINLKEVNLDYSMVVISDYNKGFLEFEDIKFICDRHEMVFVDTKKIVNESFENAFIIKLNEHEYEYNLKNQDYLNKLNNKLIITLGGRGCKYKNKIYDVEKVEIKDLSGAGDTFISSLVYKYILTNNINQSIRFANQCSTIVVQQKGVNRIGDFLG